jgi:hypothetical protein
MWLLNRSIACLLNGNPTSRCVPVKRIGVGAVQTAARWLMKYGTIETTAIPIKRVIRRARITRFAFASASPLLFTERGLRGEVAPSPVYGVGVGLRPALFESEGILPPNITIT